MKDFIHKNCTYIILTYRHDFSLLKKNISVLKNQNYLIVDNSTDSKIQNELRSEVDSPEQLVVNEKNTGYAGGMNAGMKIAFSHGTEWVVLLNDDIHLTKKSVADVEEFLSNASPGIYGPFVGSLDPHRWTTILPAKDSVDYVSGSFFIMHKKVYEVVQEFYPDFFMYYEDVDVCMQAKKAGFPVEEIKVSDAVHEDGASIEKGSDRHEYYLARNHLLFVERQAPLLVKLRELIRLPKTLWEHKYFMNTGGYKGIMDFLFVRYGKGPSSF